MAIMIKWFPPSWFQIKTEQKIIYIDPAYLRNCFKNYRKKIEFSRWPKEIDGLPEDLEKADLILVTHNHKDHCKRVTVDRLIQPDTLIVAPKRCVKPLGKEIKTISPGEEIVFEDIKIRVVEAYNIKFSKKIWHRQGDGVGYVITLKGKTIYHAGDTDFIPEMKKLGVIDIALIPIGGIFTMGIQEAVEATIAIKPKVVIPMHVLKANYQEFKTKVETRSDVQVILLQTGEVYYLEW
jgi:L-ascorbate metabolism protein UlaG (beta-lactamase superfamily)